MSDFFNNLKYQWKNSGVIFQIIIINAVIFILLNLSSFFEWNLWQYFVLNLSDPSEWLYKPWTFISCMFSHLELGHVFFNMLAFYMFARIFIVVTGFEHWSKITFIYIAGGIVGILFLIGFSFLFPRISGGYILGASDGVMALMLALGFYAPNYIVNLLFIGEVKLKWVVAFLFVVGTVVDLSVNTGGKISHLGGAVFGALYGIQLKRGNDLSAWFTNLFKKRHRPAKMKVVSKKGYSDSAGSKLRRDDERILNELLDKINKSGYESLNKQEKETLHYLSKKK